MVGVRDRVEIWAAERWDAFEEESGDSFDDLERVLNGSAKG